MYLRSVFYFIAIVESGSLSKAASKLFITQPTLSHFLAKQEEELGVKLFYRKNNNNLELTPAGQIYYDSVKKIAQIWDTMQKNLEDHKTSVTQTIRCGTGGADQIAHKLILYLPELQKRFPGIKLHSVSDTPAILHKLLLENKIDLAYSAYLEQDSRLTYLPLIVSEVDMVVRKDDPMAAYSYQLPENKNTRIRLSEVQDAQFALICEGSVMRQVEEQYFQQIGFRPCVLATYTFPPSIKEYVQNGSFYGFSARHQHAENLAYIALDPPMYYTCGLYYRSDIQQSAAIKCLISLLKRYPVDYDL